MWPKFISAYAGGFSLERSVFDGTRVAAEAVPAPTARRPKWISAYTVRGWSPFRPQNPV